jgi:hypothetical protein
MGVSFEPVGAEISTPDIHVTVVVSVPNVKQGRLFVYLVIDGDNIDSPVIYRRVFSCLYQAGLCTCILQVVGSILDHDIGYSG